MLLYNIASSGWSGRRIFAEFQASFGKRGVSWGILLFPCTIEQCAYR